MKNQLFLVILSVIVLVQGVQAISCGDSLSSSIQMNSSLYCDGSALTLTSGELNCNNNSIVGAGEGIGILIPGESNVKISNCNLINFSKGIQISKGSRTIGLGWGGTRTITIYSENTEIVNSTFTNNAYGILAHESYSTLLKNNLFIDNVEGGTYFNFAQALVFNNTFNNSPVAYKTTKGLSFCDENGVGNSYLNMTGPSCSCMTLFKTQLINSDTTLCSHKYPLPSSLKINSNTKLNCNSAILYGDGTGTGIILEGTRNTIIDSCIISNFSIGVRSKVKWTQLGNAILGDNNQIKNSTITNVNYGIIMDSYGGISRIKRIVNSTILAKNYIILNKGHGKINAQNNYFGGLSFDEVRSKIKLPNEVSLKPFLEKYQKVKIQQSTSQNSLLFTTPFVKPISKENIYIYENTNSGYKLFDKDFTFSIVDKGVPTSKVTFSNPLTNHKIFIENTTHSFELNIKEFKENISKNPFEKITINISSLNITYNILHFPSLKASNDKTVILSSGLWGSFSTWKPFAKTLQKRGYNVYVLALTGESQECRSCLNYDYEDLVSFIFPQILVFISNENEKQDIVYVGHSNGAKVAYDYSKTASKALIDKMIFLGTPGDFSTPSLFRKSMELLNSSLLNSVQNKTHVGFFDLLKGGFEFIPNIEILLHFFNDPKTLISKNLYTSYHYLIIDESKDKLFESTSEFSNGKVIHNKVIFLSGNLPLIGDGVVSYQDSQDIFKESKNYFNSSLLYSLPILHQHLDSHPRVLSFIMEEISK